MTKRLSNATLAGLPAAVARPRYDRAAMTPGIVHLGIGAFHRAHQAVMTEAAIEAGGRDWGILGASLRSAETRDALAPQDGLYAVAVREPAGERLQVVGSVLGTFVAPEDPGALLAAMADPRIRIVSLTVTEKGYCHDPATGELVAAHPDIVHDLVHPHAPRSAVGFVVAALAERRRDGTSPFAVLCCDNLPSNGATVRKVVAGFADMLDPALGAHVRSDVAFPSTMVDRIVPATADEDRARISSALGLVDAWPVVTEPFTQWVIEDHFPAGRPAWERGGAEFVGSVAPYEAMKLRMLNGAHSSLAYLGALAGHETVADAANDPRFVAFLQRFWAEVAPSLQTAPGLDAGAYARRLLERFQNRAIRHRLLQIAMDGSQKLPQRLLGTIRDNRAAGQPIGELALGVAAFLRFMATRQPDVRDPLAALFAERAGAGGAEAMLGIGQVFGGLAQDEAARSAILAAYQRLA